jgi:heme b synthase
MNSNVTKSQKTADPLPPRLIAWEVTRSCPLACKHCRAAARPTPYPGELTTEEGFRLLDNIASFAKPTMILTGGEPMLRPDIYDLAGHAHKLGLPVVMAPCGLLIDDASAARMIESGISCISISIDGATAASHDAFRGVDGAFDGAMRGIEAARRAGLAFQINTTVTRHNLAELPALLDLAVRLGAGVWNPFLLVPTGRGKELADQEISPEDYEKTLAWLADQAGREDIRIRVTCAPHYTRILLHRRKAGCESGLVAPHQHPGEKAGAKGCLGGKEFAFISHVGKVQICGFLEIECGDLKREDLDFRRIWRTSDVFRRMRDVDGYHGKCGVCEFRRLCGGCRARAFAMTGDDLAAEPFCVYQPRRG